MVFEKCTFLCPVFGAHCFLHNFNRTPPLQKKPLKPLFSAVIWLLAVKQQRPDYCRKAKNQKTLIVHFGVFGVHKNVFFCQKLTGDVWKTTIYLQVWEFFGSCFVNPFFLGLAFYFMLCLVFHFLYFFLLFHKSSFYVLVLVSVVLGFLGFDMCYLLDFFGWFLVFVFFEGLRVRWGGPKDHLTWP